MKGKFADLSSSALAMAGAFTGLVLWLLGAIWHGGLGQPSIMGSLYAMPYASMSVLGMTFLLLVAGGGLTGWLVAVGYNKALRQ